MDAPALTPIAFFAVMSAVVVPALAFFSPFAAALTIPALAVFNQVAMIRMQPQFIAAHMVALAHAEDELRSSTRA
jgi:hypothetical protein